LMEGVRRDEEKMGRAASLCLRDHVLSKRDHRGVMPLQARLPDDQAICSQVVAWQRSVRQMKVDPHGGAPRLAGAEPG
jgi:hypothetical protein